MGSTYTKIHFECHCGECQKEHNGFYMDYNRTVDIASLMYRHHGRVSELGHFTDKELRALAKLILGLEEEPWSEEDLGNPRLR